MHCLVSCFSSQFVSSVVVSTSQVSLIKKKTTMLVGTEDLTGNLMASLSNLNLFVNLYFWRALSVSPKLVYSSMTLFSCSRRCLVMNNTTCSLWDFRQQYDFQQYFQSHLVEALCRDIETRIWDECRPFLSAKLAPLFKGNCPCFRLLYEGLYPHI